MFKARLGFFDQRPISYLGVNPLSKALFSGSLLISAILFVSFGLYLKRKFQVNNRFITYFITGQVGQAIAAVVPYGLHTIHGLIHTVAAFILAFSLPFLIQQFALSQIKSRHYRLYLRLLRFEQCTFIVGIGLFIFTRGLAPLGEALPTVGFHLWIIVLTYLAFKMDRVFTPGL
jgi:hypothetical membrane protein